MVRETHKKPSAFCADISVLISLSLFATVDTFCSIVSAGVAMILQIYVFKKYVTAIIFHDFKAPQCGKNII